MFNGGAFLSKLELFKEKYCSFPKVLEYIKTYWIPYKEKFLYCFTNIYMHIGSTSTSRVEGNHSVLKSYISISKLNLLEVFKRISLMLLNQAKELKSSIMLEQLKLSHRHRLNIFASINKKVSQFALDKILEQYKYADNNEISECTGHFTKIYGLPCKHRILECIGLDSPLSLDDIHVQWRLDVDIASQGNMNDLTENATPELHVTPRKGLLQNLSDLLYKDDSIDGSLMTRLKQDSSTPFNQLLEPERVIKKRGRPVGAKNIRRDKSAFEYADAKKCGKCKQPGHNIRSCMARDT